MKRKIVKKKKKFKCEICEGVILRGKRWESGLWENCNGCYRDFFNGQTVAEVAWDDAIKD